MLCTSIKRFVNDAWLVPHLDVVTHSKHALWDRIGAFTDPDVMQQPLGPRGQCDKVAILLDTGHHTGKKIAHLQPRGAMI
jgi:hypothetical protein